MMWFLPFRHRFSPHHAISPLGILHIQYQPPPESATCGVGKPHHWSKPAEPTTSHIHTRTHDIHPHTLIYTQLTFACIFVCAIQTVVWPCHVTMLSVSGDSLASCLWLLSSFSTTFDSFKVIYNSSEAVRGSSNAVCILFDTIHVLFTTIHDSFCNIHSSLHLILLLTDIYTWLSHIRLHICNNSPINLTQQVCSFCAKIEDL
jgi:hypothetical protein